MTLAPPSAAATVAAQVASAPGSRRGAPALPHPLLGYVPSPAARARIRRCRAAGPPPGDAEVARMVAEFLRPGGAVTVCPPACVLPIHNGAGRDARRPAA